MAPSRTQSDRKPAAAPPQSPVSADEARSRFINREESWMQFNRRVLEEANDESNPLLERVKFLAITASNLDEFVEIRVAGLLQQLEDEEGFPEVRDEGGFTPQGRMDRLRGMLQQFAADQADTWNTRLAPALKEAGIRLATWKQLSESAREHASRLFESQIDPLLTPVTLDPSHPFPRVLNKALCLALLLRHKRKLPGVRRARVLGVVTIPRSMPGVIALPEHRGRQEYILLDELIEAHVGRMFRGYEVLSRAAFRVTRNSNLYLQEEESRSLLESVRAELHNRRKGDVVRMEIDASAADDIAERLRVNFELEPWQVFRTDAPVNLTRLNDLVSEVKRPDLKFPEFHGRQVRLSPKSADLFDELRRGDILLHHPFDSYSGVENFIEQATIDPNVISIRQTLYRTSADSPIFRALTEAAQNKDVTVVVELMARFDEASNIRWARELEDAGVQVFHGIYGLKTHCKLAELVRRDPDGVVRRYAHLGTGNYNPVTARFYTDISLLTARPEITDAVQRVFRYLTADWRAEPDTYRPLQVAPLTLANDILDLISRETRHARAGRPAHIVAKMNALLDARTIEALYQASQFGVEIDLIVRGMCALRPGVPGMSERIRVRSVVGRFLEHSRIFWFSNNGKPETYVGSADWMSRNLYQRCEVVFPIADAGCAARIRGEILEAYLRDNTKARLLQPDGSYRRAPRHGEPFSAQQWLMERSRQPADAPLPFSLADPAVPPRHTSRAAASDTPAAATPAPQASAAPETPPAPEIAEPRKRPKPAQSPEETNHRPAATHETEPAVPAAATTPLVPEDLAAASLSPDETPSTRREAESDAKAKSERSADAKPKAKRKAKAKTKAKPKAKPKAKLKPKAKTAAKPGKSSRKRKPAKPAKKIRFTTEIPAPPPRRPPAQ